MKWAKEGDTWISGNGRWLISPERRKGVKTLYHLTDAQRKLSLGLYVTPEDAMNRASF